MVATLQKYHQNLAQKLPAAPYITTKNNLPQFTHFGYNIPDFGYLCRYAVYHLCCIKKIKENEK